MLHQRCKYAKVLTKVANTQSCKYAEVLASRRPYPESFEMTHSATEGSVAGLLDVALFVPIFIIGATIFAASNQASFLFACSGWTASNQ